MTPPLAPPKGMLTTAHFHVISAAKPRISSNVTSGPKRMPPFEGPRAMLCCTRKPSKTSSRPLSMTTGMWTMISRFRVPVRREAVAAGSAVGFVEIQSEREEHRLALLKLVRGDQRQVIRIPKFHGPEDATDRVRAPSVTQSLTNFVNVYRDDLFATLAGGLNVSFIDKLA